MVPRLQRVTERNLNRNGPRFTPDEKIREYHTDNSNCPSNSISFMSDVISTLLTFTLSLYYFCLLNTKTGESPRYIGLIG